MTITERAAWDPATPRFDRPCGPILYLTVKRGPKAGTTLADCTCGWSRIYPTRRGAERVGANHLKVANR